MSRSFRKTPVFGNTTARSEKKSKRLANRKFRRINKKLINLDKDPKEMNVVFNVWDMEKDGKHFWKNPDPKYMRK